MNTNIFIPKLIKVGFNAREDTYTKKLGYVIYHDGKVWRKENSWESWRTKVVSTKDIETKKQKAYEAYVEQQESHYKSMQDYVRTNPSYDYYKQQLKEYPTLEDWMTKKIPSYENYHYYRNNETDDASLTPVEYENEPIEGFVLNKKAGGGGRGWDARQTVCRIYDPRGFEFEITLDNLLYILENTTSTVGKGLEGKFVYGWSGKDLVLLPENAPEYEQMIAFTELRNLQPIKKSELKPGGIYLTAQNEKVVYIDEFDYYSQHGIKEGKHFVVYNEEAYNKIYSIGIKSLKKYTGENVDNYAELHAKVLNTKPWKVEEKSSEFVKATQKNVMFSFDERNYTEIYLKKGKKYHAMYICKKHRGPLNSKTVYFLSNYNWYRGIDKQFDTIQELLDENSELYVIQKIK